MYWKILKLIHLFCDLDETTSGLDSIPQRILDTLHYIAHLYMFVCTHDPHHHVLLQIHDREFKFGGKSSLPNSGLSQEKHLHKRESFFLPLSRLFINRTT